MSSLYKQQMHHSIASPDSLTQVTSPCCPKRMQPETETKMDTKKDTFSPNNKWCKRRKTHPDQQASLDPSPQQQQQQQQQEQEQQHQVTKKRAVDDETTTHITITIMTPIIIRPGQKRVVW